MRKLFLLAMLAVAAAVFPSPAFADKCETYEDDCGTDPTDPEDPTRPGDPGNPDDPGDER